MAGTARVKRLGALALLAMLLLPPPAVAAQERQSEKEWVWGEWEGNKVRAQAERSETKREERRERQRERRAEKERDKERRERQQLLRREAREQQKSKSDDQAKYKYMYKYKSKYESKYKYEAKYKYKYEAKDRSKARAKYERRDNHHHHHGGYGLVYGGHRPHRPRPRPQYRPPPWHPCDFWDDDWFYCGGRPPSFLERYSSYVVHLIGAAPGSPGPPDTSGVAGLALVRDVLGNRPRICYRLSLRGPAAGAPLRAHVHDADRPSEPEVVDFGSVRNGGGDCRNVRSHVLQHIERDPDSFYFDVHFGGINPAALRGQLLRVDDR